MKRAWLVAAGMFMAAVCSAQMMTAHPPAGIGDMQTGASRGVVASSRTNFGAECGIQDSSVQRAVRLTRSAEGQWAAVGTEQRHAPTDTAVARVWREHNWMVDLHESPQPGMAVSKMHTGQMCFSPQGRILRMMDRYMDMQGCGCMRYTALTFDVTSGRVVRREQHFVSATTGAEIAEPEMAKSFPSVWEIRKLEQLPFYSLVKK